MTSPPADHDPVCFCLDGRATHAIRVSATVDPVIIAAMPPHLTPRPEEP